tara:strand:- start:81 stop:320 length:240 start_codon:yes stop_codon:yes gene_type:complete
MNEVRDNGEHFSYTRTWEDIEDMLRRAERKQNQHELRMRVPTASKKDKIHHMRNYKALEGVIKSLRWVLGDKNIQHPLE